MSLSLYIHIPFCQSKCFYCAFHSSPGRKDLVAPYLKALEREAASFHGTACDTVYIGGGTPTYLDTDQLSGLFDVLRSHFIFKPGAEVTLEANPATCDPKKARFLFKQGVRRISLGVQSLKDENLRLLGRPHTADEARRTFSDLRSAGFKNLNVDLIYGLPGQGVDDCLRDAAELLGFGSEHVSLYTLSIEKGSAFFERGLKTPQPEAQAALYESVTDLLVRSGMNHYEVSNFSRPGFECRHNLNYWQGGDYVGLGAAAHSHRGGTRSWNVPAIEDYVSLMETKGSALAAEETLGAQARFLETLLIGLRMTQGVDINTLKERFSSDLPSDKEELIRDLAGRGFLVWEAGCLRATRKGMLVLDEISSRLI